MADEKIDIEVTDKVAPSIETKIKGIGTAARSSHSSVQLLRAELAKLNGSSISQLKEAINNNASATLRQSTSNAKVTTEANKAASALAKEAAQMERLSQVADRAIQRAEAARAAAQRTNSTLGQQSGSRATVARADALMQSGNGVALANEIASARRMASAANVAETAIVSLETASVGRFARLRNAAAGFYDTTRDALAHFGTRFKGFFGSGGANAIAAEATAVEKLGSSSHMSSGAIRELLVLAREGGRGDFNRMAGSASLLVQQLGILRGVSLLAVAGIGAIVVALGTLAIAILTGQSEAARLENTFQILANTAGLTATSFRTMSEDIATHTHKATAEVESIGLAYLTTGNFSRQALEDITTATLRFSTLTGQTSDEVQQDFARMGEAPTRFAVELSRSYGLLSAVQVDHIRRLEEEGNRMGAVEALSHDLRSELDKQTTNVGYLAGAWNSLSTAISNAWHALQNWGRTQTDEEGIRARLDTLAQERREILAQPGNILMHVSGTGDDARFQNMTQQQALRYNEQKNHLALVQLNILNRTSAMQAENRNTQREAIAAQDHLSTTYEQTGDNAQRLHTALQAVARDYDRLRANSGTAEGLRIYNEALARRPQIEAGLRRQYMPQSVTAGNRAENAAAAEARRQAREAATAAEHRVEALRNINNELDNELSLMGALGTQREIESRMNTIQQSMIQRNITLTTGPGGEVEAIRTKVEAIVDQGHVQSEMNRIWDLTGGIEEDFRYTQEAATKLLRERIITQEQFNRVMGLATIAHEEATNPLLEYNRSLERDTNALRLYGRELEIETEALRRFDEIRRATGQAPNMDTMRQQARDRQGQHEVHDAVSPLVEQATQSRLFLQNVQAMYAEVERLRQADVLSEREAAIVKQQINEMELHARLATAENVLGQLVGLQQSKNKELQAIGKAAAIVQATIDGYLAVQKALASAPPPFNFVLAAIVGAAAAANVAAIAGFERGGYTGDGGRKDVAGVVHRKEFVVNADATSRNRQLLEAMNRGIDVNRGYATGGYVGTAAPASSNSTYRGGDTHKTIYQIDARGADAGVADRIEQILEAHEERVVDKAAHKVKQDRADAQGRQTIGGFR